MKKQQSSIWILLTICLSIALLFTLWAWNQDGNRLEEIANECIEKYNADSVAASLPNLELQRFEVLFNETFLGELQSGLDIDGAWFNETP